MKLRLIVALMFAAAACAGAKPDFSGEWKLNVAKSEFGPLPAPDSRTDKIDHKDPSLKTVRTQSSAQGEATLELNCTTDGKDCEINVRGPFQLKGSVKWDGDALAFDYKGTFGDNEVRITEKWVLAADGKTITVSRHLAGQMGEADQKMVLEKSGR